MMYSRELWISDQSTHEYVVRIKKQLERNYQELWDAQLQTRQNDREEPLWFAPGEMLWLESQRRTKGSNPKLHPKFVGPYHGWVGFANHTYHI